MLEIGKYYVCNNTYNAYRLLNFTEHGGVVLEHDNTKDIVELDEYHVLMHFSKMVDFEEVN